MRSKGVAGCAIQQSDDLVYLVLGHAVRKPDGLPSVFERNRPDSESVERSGAGTLGIVRFRIDPKIRNVQEIELANADVAEKGALDHEDAGLQGDDLSAGDHPCADI